MARVTVEDCVERVPNRFDLVMMAAQRARDISAGAQLTLDRDNDKNPVVALREIADRNVEPEALEEALVRVHQKHVETDEAEEEIIELMAGEEDWLAKGVEPTGDAEMPPAEEGAAEDAGSEAGAEGADTAVTGEEAGDDASDPMDELARRLDEELDIGGDLDEGEGVGGEGAGGEDDGTA